MRLIDADDLKNKRRYRGNIGCTHAYMDKDTVKLASPYMGDDGFCSHGEPMEVQP